jgi:hypothetical protein
MAPVHPQLDFLITASNPALESFELSHLNRRAILRKEAHEIMDKWADAEVEARFARWILDCRRAGNAGSSERPSLADHLPDLFSDSHADSPSDAPLFFPAGGASDRGPQRLAREIPQFLRQDNEPRPSAVTSRPTEQLALPMAPMLASSSRCGNGTDTPRSANTTNTAQCRSVASECADATLRSLEFRSHRNANDDVSISDAWSPVLLPRARRPSRRIRSSSSAPLNPCAEHPSAKFAAARSSLFATRPSRRSCEGSSNEDVFISDVAALHLSTRANRVSGCESAITAAVVSPGAPRPSSKSIAVQTALFPKRPSRRTRSSSSSSLKTRAKHSSTTSIAGQTSLFTTQDLFSSAPRRIARMQVTSGNERSPRARNAKRFARQTSRRKFERATPTLSRSITTSRENTSAYATSRPKHQLVDTPDKGGAPGNGRARRARRRAHSLRTSFAMSPFWQPRLLAPQVNMFQQAARSAL